MEATPFEVTQINIINQYQLTISMLSFSSNVFLILNVAIHFHFDGAKEIVRTGDKATLLCSVSNDLTFEFYKLIRKITFFCF